MARDKKKSRTKKDLLPEDVLEGRVKPDPLELFRLIHRVNPTNRPLSLQEARRRYGEKHKLQSFLVLHYGEEHVVVARDEQEGVVRFDHPSGIFDACHAPLAELEPEARSLIQRRLDMEGAGEDEPLRLPAAQDGAGEAPEDLLSAARRALAEFDYTQAEKLLTRAFDAGDGGVPAAVELLALEVETLGLDEEALALHPRLSSTALDDVDVRSLLATSAARTGRLELAEKLISGLGDPGASTPPPRRTAAYAALATGAARAGDEEAARRWLEVLLEVDPFHEAVATVRTELDRLEETGMRRAEAELDELYRERGSLGAATAARALADRWPASEVARRVLREAGELRRETAVAEHLEIADGALADGDFDTAVRHYEAVLAEDADVPDVPRRLGEARRGAREKAEASVVDGVERRFAEDEAHRALLAYLELPQALRERLRSRLEDEDARSATVDLDTVASAHPNLKATAVVEAVLSLRTAEKLLAEQRAEEAFLALHPHRDAVGEIPRAESLFKQVLERLMGARAERNLELIRQVEAAMKGETEELDPEKNLELLDQVDPDFLSPAYQQWVESAKVTMQQTLELNSIADFYKSELEAGHLFAARRRARQYKEMATRILPAEMLESWKFPGAFLDDEIKRVWQVGHESRRLGKPLGRYPGLLQPRPGRPWRSETCGLDDEGRRLVVVQAFVDWLFVRLVDVVGGKVLERLSMNTPKPLGAPLAVCWDGDVIRIGGGEGGIVVLEPEGWKIAEWTWLPGHLGQGKIEQTVVLPRSPYAWVLSRNRETGHKKARVLDRDAWRVMRQHARVVEASVLYGLRPYGCEEAPDPPEPKIFLASRKGTYLCTARGHREADETLTDRCAVAAAASGQGIVALLLPPADKTRPVVGPPEGDEDPEYHAGLGLARFEPGPDGWRLAREVRVAAKMHPTAMVAAQGVAWALYDGADGEAWLLAVEAETLEPLYFLKVPHASALAGNRHASHAVLLLDGERGPEVVRLGRAAPRLQWKWRPLAQRSLPIVELHISCVCRVGKGREALTAFDAIPASQRRDYVLALARESSASDMEDVIVQAYVLHDRDEALARAFLSELHRRHPENLDVMFLIAEWQCRLASVSETLEDWKQGLQMVLGIDPEWMTMFLRHFYHLQGMAYLLAGNFEESLKAFEAGLEHHDAGCDLEPLMELVKPMNDPPKASQWSAKHPLTRQLVGALRTASAAIGRDDDKAAIKALERPPTWLAAETESLTRLALAHIALVDDPIDAGFEARLALSYLLEVIKVKGPRRIPPAELSTAKENMKTTADTLRQWLAVVANAEASVKAEGE